MKRATAETELPQGISFFFIYTAPNYNEQDAIQGATTRIKTAEGDLKHYGCAFAINRQ